MRSGGVAAVMLALLLALPPSSSAQQHDHALYPPRETSGTAWTPDATPMFGVGWTWRGWESMVHGTVFGQVLFESDEKHRTGGADGVQPSSGNWGMFMARRPLGGGRFGVRTMISVEPWTVADCGFLNLLATGEVCDGDTIHDRQHPHDLFMELAAEFDRPLAGSLRWQVYGGLAGEPALGPPGFPHRLSSIANPVAPITHHWLDSSHIAFGLVTAAVYSSTWKVDASAFNGREPDEHRADFDLGTLDSWSARFSVMPTTHLVLQASSAHLTEAEAEFPPLPRSDLHRTTASATYHRPFGTAGTWATMAAYGVNAGAEVLPDGPVELTTHAGLIESTLLLDDRHWFFGRAEIAGKPAHDLHAHEYGPAVFTVGKILGGYTRNLAPWHGAAPGVGALVSASLVPAELAPRYGGRVAWGLGLYVSLRPARH